MQLEVQAGTPVTITGLEEAPVLEVGQGQVLTLTLAGEQGLPGPAGTDLTGVAASTLNGHRAVAWQGGLLVHADSSNIAHLFALAGVIEAAAAAGDTVPIKAAGVVTYSGWSWSAGPVWYGTDGSLTQTQPAGYPRVIGRGDGQRLFIDIQPPVQVI